MIYLWLFLEFLKIGLFTFGGGYAMIPLVQETIEKHGWLTESQFTYMIGLCEVTPGPIALNMATFVGATNGGFLGGLLATLGVVIPSFVIICIVAALLAKFAKNKYVNYALKGTMAVAIGLIIYATLVMIGQVLTPVSITNNSLKISANLNSLRLFVLVVGAYGLMWILRKKKPGPISVIGMAALVGLIFGFMG